MHMLGAKQEGGPEPRGRFTEGRVCLAAWNRDLGEYSMTGPSRSRVTTAGCGLCPGWLGPPTFVSDSDGTAAAGEGLVLAGKPDRHVPGLGGRESKAWRTQGRACKARKGPLSLGAQSSHSTAVGSAGSMNQTPQDEGQHRAERKPATPSVLSTPLTITSRAGDPDLLFLFLL